MNRFISISILASLLGGCGGGSSDDTIVEPGPTPPVSTGGVDYQKLHYSAPGLEPLVAIEGEALETYLKNGLRLQVAGNYYAREIDDAPNTDLDFSPAPPASADGAESYSDTNVHVTGVDEADVAKYDGSHWFVIYAPNYDSSGALPGLQIVATHPAVPDASVVGRYAFAGDEWSVPDAIYLYPDNTAATEVVALRNQWGSVEPQLPGLTVDIMSDIWLPPTNSELELLFVDVADPAQPVDAGSIRIDGSLIDSRRIGDTLYLVTRFDPWLVNLAAEAAPGAGREQNENLLDALSVADLMPQYHIGETSHALSDTCFVEADTREGAGFSSLVHITAVNLADHSVLSSQCVGTSVQSLTMSPDALYLSGNAWVDGEGSYTALHKFTLGETGVNYTATGSVAGHLGWRTDPAFRLHEYNGDLRVVSTRTYDGDFEHLLTIFEQSGDRLLPVTQLPNGDQPAAIGKPGEDIYAVRFTDSRAYIVTFRQIDPLYVIDLSNRSQPRVTGELEVPGFSTYLHPLNDNYLFTLGQQVDADSQWFDGVQVQLVRVTDGTPELVGRINIDGQGSYTEALNNLHALSFLPVGDDAMRVVFPVSVYSGGRSESDLWQYSGLQMIELTGLNGTDAELQDKGVLIAQSATNGLQDYGSGVRRGLLHQDAVFYAHDNQIWFSEWGSGATPGGPVGGEPIACTEEIRYGLEVVVWNEAADNCSATVTATDGSYSEQLVPSPHSVWSDCTFTGAPERAGTYDITVALDGYATQTHSGIRVSQGACHVQTRWIHVTLTTQE